MLRLLLLITNNEFWSHASGLCCATMSTDDYRLVSFEKTITKSKLSDDVAGYDISTSEGLSQNLSKSSDTAAMNRCHDGLRAPIIGRSRK
ncbi:hypothetical protein H2248_011718 [Termitomyces sp. 'cryptogamus']|nr:hypothetical protein H2248_011718 [Termitomyces sp. 'cryptogamus']